MACRKLGDRADPLQAAALVDRLAEVDEHHDARLDGHAEAGDVADLDRDAEPKPKSHWKIAPPASAPRTLVIISSGVDQLWCVR